MYERSSYRTHTWSPTQTECRPRIETWICARHNRGHLTNCTGTLTKPLGIGARLTCRLPTNTNTVKHTDFALNTQWRGMHTRFEPGQFCSHPLNMSYCERLLCQMGNPVFACAKSACCSNHHAIGYSLCNHARRAGARAETEQIVAAFGIATGRNKQDEVLRADLRIQEHLGHTPKWLDVVNVHNYGWSSRKHADLPS